MIVQLGSFKIILESSGVTKVIMKSGIKRKYAHEFKINMIICALINMLY